MRSDQIGTVVCGAAGRLVRDPVHLDTFTGGDRRAKLSSC